MKNKDDRPEQAAALRRRAEEIPREKAAQSAEDLESLSSPVGDFQGASEETRQTLHELRVHQIELELQNEELRRAQTDLDAARARYFDLYDLAPVGYCTLSEKGLILEANLTAATLLGVAPGALVTQPFTRFILREDQDFYYLYLRQLFGTGGPQACELRMVKKDGTVFWAHLDATVAQDPSTLRPGSAQASSGQDPSTSSGQDAEGAPVCRAVVSDITERKRAEEEKEKLEAQFHHAQRAESLGRMAGGIAHHYNNLMGIVMGSLERFMYEQPPGSRPAESIARAMEASRWAAEISRQMLAYLGQATGKKEPTDLSEACREVLLLLTASLPKKARLNTQFPAEGVIVLADAVQMKHVLTNLVVNAGEAMHGGEGDITVAITLIPAADIHASRFYPSGWKPKAEAYACLSITDTACGMDPETVDKLFEPFFSTKFTGRGLGLPVVMGIVKAHEGGVTVESRPGQGATFRVFLPVTDQTPRQTRKAKPVESSAVQGRGLVLVVEDEPLMRELAEIMLQHIGYEVITAADGVEAGEVFQQHKDEIRCVLCDLTMPRMDGWETLEALRRIQPDLAVILASGYAETQVMQGEHPEQPQAFLHKPYMSADLEAALAAALRGHR